MSVSTKQLSQKLIALAETWTRDPFRPNLQLPTFLKSLAAHPRLTPHAVEATRALRDNEVSKKYPLSDKMMKPASSPHYYERLVDGWEKSSQGIGRPWWKVFFGIW